VVECVRVLARDTKGRGFDSRPFHFQITTLGKLFTYRCLCHQAVQLGTGQGAVMPCGWEGKLAMRHRLKCFVHLQAHGSRPRQGDEQPAYALLWSMAHTYRETEGCDGPSLHKTSSVCFAVSLCRLEYKIQLETKSVGLVDRSSFSSVGSQFHVRGAATEKSLSPIGRRVRGTTRSPDDEARSADRAGTSASDIRKSDMHAGVSSNRSVLTHATPILALC